MEEYRVLECADCVAVDSEGQKGEGLVASVCIVASIRVARISLFEYTTAVMPERCREAP